MKLQIKSRRLLFDIFDNMVTQILVRGYSEYPFKLINITNSLRTYGR
jgi:hypothetical protein